MALTDRQIEAQVEAAIARQQKIDAAEPRANKVLFNDRRKGLPASFTLHFTKGASFSFLARSVEAIATLPTKILVK